MAEFSVSIIIPAFHSDVRDVMRELKDRVLIVRTILPSKVLHLLRMHGISAQKRRAENI